MTEASIASEIARTIRRIRYGDVCDIVIDSENCRWHVNRFVEAKVRSRCEESVARKGDRHMSLDNDLLIGRNRGVSN